MAYDPTRFTGTRVLMVDETGASVPTNDAQIAIGVARLPSSAATTNAGVAKASSGRLLKVTGLNTVASARYLKIYNKATAPTVGTDPIIMTLAIPASAGFAFDIPAYLFSTGVAYAITGAAADADTTAIGAGDITGLNLFYA